MVAIEKYRLPHEKASYYLPSHGKTAGSHRSGISSRIQRLQRLPVMIECPSTAADLADRFERALYTTTRAWRRAVDQRLKSRGMSVGRVSWMTIAAAAQSRPPMSQSALADLLLVADASMVHMIDDLADAGLVMRERSKTDRRVKRVLLTDAGHRLYSELKDEAAAAREQLLAPIGWDKLAQLTAFLDQLHSLLDPVHGGASRHAPALHQIVGRPRP